MEAIVLLPETFQRVMNVVNQFNQSDRDPNRNRANNAPLVSLVTCGSYVGITSGGLAYHYCNAPKWLLSSPSTNNISLDGIGTGDGWLISSGKEPLAEGTDYLTVAGPDAYLDNLSAVKEYRATRIVAPREVGVAIIGAKQSGTLGGVEFYKATISLWNSTTQAFQSFVADAAFAFGPPNHRLSYGGSYLAMCAGATTVSGVTKPVYVCTGSLDHIVKITSTTRNGNGLFPAQIRYYSAETNSWADGATVQVADANNP